MSKRWRIPDTINPVGTVCVQLQIPDDSTYIEHFWGALEALCKAWNYDYTPTKEGSQVAYVWQAVIDSAADDVRNGVACEMPIDCNEVETCLSTSAIIAAIQSDILALQTNDAIQDSDIDTLQSDVNTIKTVDIPQINLTLADHETRLDAIELDLAQKTLNDTDHDNRITDLENIHPHNYGSGGGGQLVEFSANSHFLNADLPTTLINVWELASFITHTFTHPNALIIIEVKGRSTTAAPIGKLRIKVNGVAGSQEGWTQDVNVQSLQVNDKFTGIVTGSPVQVQLEFATTGGVFVLSDNQYVQYSIWEFSDAPTGNPDVVTFDTGGHPYTLPVGQIGTIQSVGNPDNALQGINASNGVNGDYIEVEIDLGSATQINDISYDLWNNHASGHAGVTIYFDGVPDNYGNDIYAKDTWVSTNWSAKGTGVFPITAQLVRVRAWAWSSETIPDLRLDNIFVDTT